jgi:hypothetical protein
VLHLLLDRLFGPFDPFAQFLERILRSGLVVGSRCAEEARGPSR